jgi:hypothetical protein
VTTDNFYRHFLCRRSFENQYYSSGDNAENVERSAEIVGAEGKSSYVFITFSFQQKYHNGVLCTKATQMLCLAGIMNTAFLMKTINSSQI